MSMIRRGTTGRVEEFAQPDQDGSLMCNACSRIIVSKVNLQDGHLCPFCHYDVNQVIDGDVASDNNDPDIARPC